MKKIRVREAKPRDLGLFRKLQAEFSADPDNEGTLVKYEPETYEFFDGLFNLYVEDDSGFILFVGEWGMIVAGALRAEAKFKMGDVANIWFAFVSTEGRDSGIEEALFEETMKRLQEQGYNGVTFGTPTVGKWTEVAENFGFNPFMLTFSKEFSQE